MTKRVPKMTGVDVQYALRELEAWGARERGARLTWAVIAKTVGFSRQALSDRREVAEAFKKAKAALARPRPAKPARAEDFLEKRIEHLQAELARYKEIERTHLERWARFAYHLRGKGLSITDLDRPIPKVKR